MSGAYKLCCRRGRRTKTRLRGKNDAVWLMLMFEAYRLSQLSQRTCGGLIEVEVEVAAKVDGIGGVNGGGTRDGRRGDSDLGGGAGGKGVATASPTPCHLPGPGVRPGQAAGALRSLGWDLSGVGGDRKEEGAPGGGDVAAGVRWRWEVGGPPEGMEKVLRECRRQGRVSIQGGERRRSPGDGRVGRRPVGQVGDRSQGRERVERRRGIQVRDRSQRGNEVERRQPGGGGVQVRDRIEGEGEEGVERGIQVGDRSRDGEGIERRPRVEGGGRSGGLHGGQHGWTARGLPIGDGADDCVVAVGQWVLLLPGLVAKPVARNEVGKPGVVVADARQAARHDVGHPVVADDHDLASVDLHADGLFDQLVNQPHARLVGQRANVFPPDLLLALGDAPGGGGGGGSGGGGNTLPAARPLARDPLAVHHRVAERAAGRPGEVVGPSFDARRLELENKNRSAPDPPPLGLGQSALDEWDVPGASGLDEMQGVPSRLDPAPRAGEGTARVALGIDPGEPLVLGAAVRGAVVRHCENNGKKCKKCLGVVGSTRKKKNCVG
ncbi:hypothetical protein VTK26DRAFT_447 [Humicola hyalothermophila]